MRDFTLTLCTPPPISLLKKQFTNWGTCKYFLVIVFFFIALASNATNYYVSSVGNDGNSGTSESKPWRSITKVNNTKFLPGDKVMFRRGDSFVGSISVTNSGTSGSFITYGAYGAGDKPKIYGSKQISGWTKHSGNIYKTQFPNDIDQLFINGSRISIARYPDSGFFDITSTISSTRFKSTELNPGINYTGAIWIGRTSAFTVQSENVIASNSQTITIDKAPYIGLGVGEGFFLMNKLEFLNRPGEWYYDIQTKTVYLWTPNGDSPNNYEVRGSTYDNIVEVTNSSYVKICDLEMLHAADDGIYVYNGDNLLIENNDIICPAVSGIYSSNTGSVNSVLKDNYIYQAIQTGIKYISPGAKIIGNTVDGTFKYENISKSVDLNDNAGTGIQVAGKYITVEYNRVLNSGYCGINFYGAYNTINYNYINGSCLLLDDGAGIYTYNGYDYSAGGSTGSVIKGNIVLNSYGNSEGDRKDYLLGYGIYMDHAIHHVDILENTIAGATCGLFINPCGFIKADKNIIMDATLLLHIDDEFDNSTITNNIFYTTAREGHYIWWGSEAHQRFVFQSSGATALFNHNKYINHYETKDVFPNKTDFSVWKAHTGQDVNSTYDAGRFNNGETEQLFYNDTKSTKSFNLGNSEYKDINGNRVVGSITLEPFKSRILIKTSTNDVDPNQPPLIEDLNFEIQGSKSVNEIIGNIIASDPDQGQELSYQIVSGNENNLFAVNSNTGVIYAKTNIEVTYSHTVTLIVKATDNAVDPLSATANVKINMIKKVIDPIIDVVAPVVSSFVIPSSSNSLTVPISIFTATDNFGVTGYKLTEVASTPQASDNDWSISIPDVYVFSSTGNKTLYAWAKDAAGNISNKKVSSILVELPTIDSMEYVTICEGDSYNGWTTSGTYQRNENDLSESSTSVSENQISNDKFTNGYNGWVNWGAPGYIINLNLNYEEYISAPASLQIACTRTGTSTLSLALIGQNVSIEKGKEYELTFYAKATTEFNIGRLLIRKRTSPWSVYGSYDNEKPLITKTWKQYKVKFTATHTANDASFQIYFGNSLPAGQTMYLDDISFSKITSESEVPNQKITTFLTVVQSQNTTEEVTINEGESYLSWNKTGVYERTLSNYLGCDSIVTTYLNVLKSTETVEDIFICEGSSYQGWTSEGQYQRVLDGFSGADSIVKTNLWINPVYHSNERVSISSGEVYNGWTKTGVYERTLTSISGCDSIVTTELNVISSSFTEEYVNICEGESYKGWETSGTYQRTENNSGGSTVNSENQISNGQFTNGYSEWIRWGASGYNINLDIDNSDYISAPASLEVTCTSSGSSTSSLILIGQNLSIEAGKEYELTFYAKATTEFNIGNLVIRKRTSPWTRFGSYDNTQPHITKVWQQHKVKFTATHTANDASFQIYLGNSLPVGQSLLVDDFNFSEITAGETMNTIVTHLTVNQAKYTTENVVISEGDKYLGWTKAGTYERTLSSVSGCDSVVTTYLTVLHPTSTVEDVFICKGSSYKGWTKEGQYERVLHASSGSDSIVITNLWINPVYHISESIYISDGEQYNGWTESGIYERNLSTQSGCDSIVTTELNIITKSFNEEYITICEGETYNGLTSSGSYQRTEINAQDLIHLEASNQISNNKFSNGYGGWYKWGASGYDFNLRTEDDDYISAPSSLKITCTRTGSSTSSLILIGQNLSIEAGKEYALVFYAKATTEFNIGSLVIRKRTSPWTRFGTYDNDQPRITKSWKQHVVKFTATHTANDASFQIYLGNSLPSGQSLLFDDFIFSELSTESLNETVTHLTVNPTQFSSEEVIISEGESYLGWTNTGQYKHTLTSASGCDSVITTYLTVLGTINTITANEYNIETEEDIFICEGNSYLNWNSTGQYQRVLKNLNGADSTITTNLWVNPVYTTNEEISIEKGDNYFGWSQPGKYERNLTSSCGCDSIVITQLEFLKTTSVNELMFNDVRLYPNPASDNITIQFSTQPREGTQLILSDINGRILEKLNINSIRENIDIQQYRSGNYFVKMIYGNTCKVEKFIIQ